MEQPSIIPDTDAGLWHWAFGAIIAAFGSVITWLRQVDGKRISAIEDDAKDIRGRIDKREERDRERWEAFLERFDRKIDQLRTDFLHVGNKHGGSSD